MKSLLIIITPLESWKRVKSTQIWGEITLFIFCSAGHKTEQRQRIVDRLSEILSGENHSQILNQAWEMVVPQQSSQSVTMTIKTCRQLCSQQTHINGLVHPRTHSRTTYLVWFTQCTTISQTALCIHLLETKRTHTNSQNEPESWTQMMNSDIQCKLRAII